MIPAFHSALPQPDLPPRIRSFLVATTEACNQNGRTLVSIVLFGSAVRGGFAQQASDVDPILLLPDSASQEELARVKKEDSPVLPRNRYTAIRDDQPK